MPFMATAKFVMEKEPKNTVIAVPTFVFRNYLEGPIYRCDALCTTCHAL